MFPASSAPVHIIFALPCGEQKGRILPVKWELVANNLSQAGWSCGCVTAVDSKGRTISVADTHRGDGKRFIIRGRRYCLATTEP